MEVGGGGGAKREIIYLSLHCHHHNGSCIKMGSDESHFNVSLIVRDGVQGPQPLKRHTHTHRAEADLNQCPPA